MHIGLLPEVFGYAFVSRSLHGGRMLRTGFWDSDLTMAERVLRFARSMAPTIGLLGAGLSVAVTLMSALHPQVLERNPLHLHVVVGGTSVEQARALAAHFRGTAESPTARSSIRRAEACGEGHAAEAHVLSIRAGDATSTSVSSVGALIAAGGAAAPLPAVIPPARLTMLPDVPARVFTPSVPDPPPRAS